MKTLMRRSLRASASAALVLSLAACGGSSKQVLNDGKKSENLATATKTPGSVDTGLPLPPTVERMAQVKVEGVAAVMATSPSGVLLLSEDRQRIMRMQNGEVVWSSDAKGGKIVDADFVQAGGRPWVVAVREVKDGRTVDVHDAFGLGNNRTPLRRVNAKGGVTINPSGIVSSDLGGAKRIYPDTGLAASVTLPKKAGIIGATEGGYLVSINDSVALASTQKGGGWTSAQFRPKNMSNKATSSVVGTSPAVIAIEWAEGNKRATSFVSTETGKLVAETDRAIKFGARERTLGSAESRAAMFLGNAVVNTDTGEITFYDVDVQDIIDGVVYLADGRGVGIEDGKSAWREGAVSEPPLFIFERSAYFLKGNTLFVAAMKRSVSEASSASSSSSSSSS